ncbi:MAG: sodium:solute symporter family protein [Deltaproteobacteria bacterium]|nr:sodium:solute symporter family protein [Deltaproteobacteria bacterium]
MTVSFTFLDYSIMVAYFIALIGIGYGCSRRIKGMESYILAGRQLTLPLFVGTLVSTWYGGIIGVGEISYEAGIYNWVTQGLFWYISYIIFAFFLAARLRESNQYTLPDQLEIFYGKPARKLGLVLNFFNMVPIVYVISLGVMIEVLFGIPLPTGIVLGGIFCILYTWMGGFPADVYTDFLQFFLMCIGVALIIPFCFIKLGGWAYLTSHTPASHFTWTGGYPIAELLVWGFIALSTLVDPTFYQRCYAAQNAKIAKKGIILSVLFWMLFDVCTTFAGIYARAAFPEIDPKHAYPMLANLVLPPVMKGIFFTGMLATIMSTVDSYFFVAATTLSRDLYQKIIHPQASDRQVVWMTRVGILVTGTVAIFLALGLYESIKAVWKLFGSLSAATMLVPLMMGFWFKGPIRKEAGVYAMWAGFIMGAIFYSGDKFFHIAWIAKIEPLYPGMLASLAAFLLANRGARRRV